MVTSIINSLSTRYGGAILLTISRGKIYEYLGMTFDYTTAEEVKVTMYDYIDRLLENAPTLWKYGIGMVTPVPNNLYKTR